MSNYIMEMLPNTKHALGSQVLEEIYQEAKAKGYECYGASFSLGKDMELIFDEEDGTEWVMKRVPETRAVTWNKQITTPELMALVIKTIDTILGEGTCWNITVESFNGEDKKDTIIEADTFINLRGENSLGIEVSFYVGEDRTDDCSSFRCPVNAWTEPHWWNGFVDCLERARDTGVPFLGSWNGQTI